MQRLPLRPLASVPTVPLCLRIHLLVSECREALSTDSSPVVLRCLDTCWSHGIRTCQATSHGITYAQRNMHKICTWIVYDEVRCSIAILHSCHVSLPPQQPCAALKMQCIHASLYGHSVARERYSERSWLDFHQNLARMAAESYGSWYPGPLLSRTRRQKKVS